MKIKKNNFLCLSIAIMLIFSMFLGMFIVNAAPEISNGGKTIIIDNADAQTQGTWLVGSSRAGKYGSDYRVGQKDPTGNTYMIWRPEITIAGAYHVYYILPDGTADSANLASDAHYTVGYESGTDEQRISQRGTGGTWKLFGTYNFALGTGGYVKLSTDVDSTNTMGDAIKFEYAGAAIENDPIEITLDNTDATLTGTWRTSTYRTGYHGIDYLTTTTNDEPGSVIYTPDIPRAGSYAVYYKGPKGDCSGVPYVVKSADGETKNLFDQTADTTDWTLVGNYLFNKGSGGSVTIFNQGSAEHVFADGFKFVSLDKTVNDKKFTTSGTWDAVSDEDAVEGQYIRSNEASCTAEYTFTPQMTGYYLLDYSIPQIVSGVTDNMKVTVGETQISADLSSLPLGMNELGVFYFEAGTSYVVNLSNAGTGTMIFDAVRFRFSGYDLMYNTFEKSSDLSEWATTGTAGLSGGDLVLTNGVARITRPQWTNVKFATVFKADSLPAGCEFGMILDGSNNTYTKLYYKAEDSCFIVYDSQNKNEIARSETLSITAGQSYVLTVNFTFPEMTAFLNGTKIISASYGRGGEVGFFTTGNTVRFEGLYAAGTRGAKVTEGNYKVNLDKPKQTIWGLGIEVQSDSIGSGNLGLPESNTSVPHDLVSTERDRLYNDMLSGFRYLRLAGGLYYRGTDDEKKHLQERWETQNEELAELIEKSGIEGVDFEFWSPTPYFKSSDSYLTTDWKNTLKCFDPSFMGDKQIGRAHV